MTQLTILGFIAAVGLVYVVLPVVADAYYRFRGTKTIICPETNAPADIELDAVRAAASAAVGYCDLRVVHCTRRHERHYCEQECVAQIT